MEVISSQQNNASEQELSDEEYFEFIKQFTYELARSYAIIKNTIYPIYPEPHINQEMCMSAEEFAKHVPYMTIRI